MSGALGQFKIATAGGLAFFNLVASGPKSIQVRGSVAGLLDSVK
jgi:hypothetical protein